MCGQFAFRLQFVVLQQSTFCSKAWQYSNTAMLQDVHEEHKNKCVLWVFLSNCIIICELTSSRTTGQSVKH